MWLKSLEIAIIEKNTDAIDALLKESPAFETIEEMRRAQYLLLEASKLLHALKEQSAATMKQLKKNIDFLKVSERKFPNRLDIHS